MTKKVCVLLNNEYIWDNRVERGVEVLVQQGYQVTVLAVLDKMRQLPIREQKNGATICRIFPKRLPQYTPLRLRELFTHVWRIHQSGVGPFDIYHAHNADTLQLADCLARWNRRPLLYDAHEWWDAFFDGRQKAIEQEKLAIQNPRKLNTALKRLEQMRQLEAKLLSRCHGFISVCDSLCRLYSQKAAIPLANPVTLRNIPPYFTLQDGEPQKRFHQQFNLNPNTRIVLYQGALAGSRGIELMLEAWKKLNDPNLALILMGQAKEEYVEQLKDKIKAGNIENIFFKAPVYGKEFLYWTQSADLGLSPILNHNLSYYYCLPNKIFEYIQAEVPMAVSNFPEMAAVVDQYGVGFTFDPEDADALAEKIKAYFNSPDQQQKYRDNIRRAKQELTWENEGKRLIALYQEVLSP